MQKCKLFGKKSRGIDIWAVSSAVVEKWTRNPTKCLITKIFEGGIQSVCACGISGNQSAGTKYQFS